MFFKICLTGGPCAGKSSMLEIIKYELECRRWKVFIINEVATSLMNEGVILDSKINKNVFQKMIFDRQLFIEKQYEELSELYEKCIILCDRGVFDQLAYVERCVFESFLSNVDITYECFMKSYYAVIHLASLAIDTNLYSFSNNNKRYSTKEQAMIIDNKIYKSWCNHLRWFYVDNSTDFAGKVKRVINIIFDVLPS